MKRKSEEATSAYQVDSLPKPSTSKEEKSDPVRRPLNTALLLPPDYTVDPHRLLHGYVEKEVKYGGKLSKVEFDLDVTNRIQLLRVLDQAKRESLIPWKLSKEDDAIFSVSSQNVKVSRRDGKEELKLRLAIHEIAELSYIRDDGSHLVIIKFGNPQESTDMCQIAVLYCDNQTGAEEVCSLVNQCFQLVYTEATMQFLDEELQEAATGLSISSGATVRTNRSDVSRGSMSQNSNASTPNWRRLDPTKPSFLSQSQYDLEDDPNNGSNSAVPPPGTLTSPAYTAGSRSLPRLPNYSPANSEGDLSPAAKEVLSDYMKELQTKLTKPELKKFAMLIKAWREEKMQFYSFCDKVFDLYGPERKYLLPGMRPFLGEREEESSYFESFLERVGAVKGLAEAAQSLGSRYALVAGPPLNHPMDPQGAAAGGDDFDRGMADIQQHISSMGHAVDISTSLDQFLPKS